MRSKRFLHAEQTPLDWDTPGLVAGVEDVEANASLALDGHKVVVNTVGVHELSHVGAHVAAE